MSTTSAIVLLVVAKDNIEDIPMSEEFLPNSEIYSAPPGSSAPTPPSREPVHITVIGSATGIDTVVKILHSLGFAETRAWSKPQIDPNTGRPMRVLTKWLRY
ncbi:hypothetical protein [Nodosilinea sp. FACHB-141]|nr:hypothetical protein [Nodosilinea sp. FACHB-141]